MPDVPGRYPGVLAVDLAGQFVGAVMVERRGAGRAGHLFDAAGELEISFTVLPRHWGHGYAREAAEAVLGWIGSQFQASPCCSARRLRTCGRWHSPSASASTMWRR